MIPESLKDDCLPSCSSVTPREAAVDVMKELQKHYGWLSDEAVDEVAESSGCLRSRWRSWLPFTK